MSYELGNTDTRLPSPCAGQSTAHPRIVGVRRCSARIVKPAVALGRRAMHTMNIVPLLFLACVAGCGEFHRSLLRRLATAGALFSLVATLGRGVSSLRNHTRSGQPIQSSWMRCAAFVLQQPATRSTGAVPCKQFSSLTLTETPTRIPTAASMRKLYRC